MRNKSGADSIKELKKAKQEFLNKLLSIDSDIIKSLKDYAPKGAELKNKTDINNFILSQNINLTNWRSKKDLDIRFLICAYYEINAIKSVLSTYNRAIETFAQNKITFDNVIRRCLNEMDFNIFSMTAQGLKQKDIAEKLHISKKSIEYHLNKILKNLYEVPFIAVILDKETSPVKSIKLLSKIFKYEFIIKI